MYEDIDLFDNTRGGYNIDNSSDNELNRLYKNVINARFGGKFISKTKETDKSKEDKKDDKNSDSDQDDEFLNKSNKKHRPKSLSELLERISSEVKIEKGGGNETNNDHIQLHDDVEKYPDSMFNMINIPSENNDTKSLDKTQNDVDYNDLFTSSKHIKTKKKGGNGVKFVDASPRGLDYTKDVKTEYVDKGVDKDYIKFINEQKYGTIDKIGDPENVLFNYTKEPTEDIDSLFNSNKDKLTESTLTSITDETINTFESNNSTSSKPTLLNSDKTLNNIEQNDDNIDSLFKD
jgi:hypothetical protein